MLHLASNSDTSQRPKEAFAWFAALEVQGMKTKAMNGNLQNLQDVERQDETPNFVHLHKKQTTFSCLFLILYFILHLILYFIPYIIFYFTTTQSSHWLSFITKQQAIFLYFSKHLQISIHLYQWWKWQATGKDTFLSYCIGFLGLMIKAFPWFLYWQAQYA